MQDIVRGCSRAFFISIAPIELNACVRPRTAASCIRSDTQSSRSVVAHRHSWPHDGGLTRKQIRFGLTSLGQAREHTAGGFIPTKELFRDLIKRSLIHTF